jgi:hypothetical protein
MKHTGVAKGRVTIYTGDYSTGKGGEEEWISIETKVTVLEEGPEHFLVEYPNRFKQRYPEYCQSNVIKKGIANQCHAGDRELHYTVFTAVEEFPFPVGTRRARCAHGFMFYHQDRLKNGAARTEVLIVDETKTHYRLRFALDYSVLHPEFCFEWVAKDDELIKIEVID